MAKLVPGLGSPLESWRLFDDALAINSFEVILMSDRIATLN